MPNLKANDFQEDLPRPRKIEVVPTAEISTDPLVQPRAKLDPSVVAEYADRMGEGADFPPLVTVLIDGRYLLVDGYMRFEAAKLTGIETLKCEVHLGDLRVAMLLSSEANCSHGLRRTREDMRRSAARLLTDAEWSGWSDREIGRRCGVSHTMVGQLRSQLTGNIASDERRFVNKHGSVSTMNVTALASRPVPRITSIDNPASPPPAGATASVVSLSRFSRDLRADFVSGVRRMEDELERLPPVSCVLTDPADDVAVAGRLIAIARRARAMAEMLQGVGDMRLRN